MRADDRWQSWDTSAVRGDRISFWSDVVVRGVINSQMGQLTDGRFDGELWSRSSRSARFVNFRAREHSIHRTASQTRGGDGHIMIGLQCRGESWMTQGDARVRLTPGEIAIIDSNRPFRLVFPDTVERRLVLLPRPDFRQWLNRNATFSAPRTLAGRSGDEELARYVVRKLTDIASHHSEDACADMMAVLVGALTGVLEPDARSERRDRTRAARIRMHMRERLADPATDPQRIAAIAGVSVRSLHRLFASEGCTFSQTLLNMRLDNADAAIQAKSPTTLTDIAFANGFADLAHFSRRYREKFDEPPSAARSRAR